MNSNTNGVDRLGGAISAAARSQPGLIGGAIAVWEDAHPGRSAAEYLRCDQNQLWRVAVAPVPTGTNLVPRAMELAADLGINGLGLVNLLRFAENASALVAASEDGEMLMAALDATDEDDAP